MSLGALWKIDFTAVTMAMGTAVVLWWWALSECDYGDQLQSSDRDVDNAHVLLLTFNTIKQTNVLIIVDFVQEVGFIVQWKCFFVKRHASYGSNVWNFIYMVFWYRTLLWIFFPFVEISIIQVYKRLNGLAHHNYNKHEPHKWHASQNSNSNKGDYVNNLFF